MQYIYTRSKLSPVILPMEASCLCWKEGWQLEDQVYDCSCQGCPLLGEVGILWASLCLFHFHQYCCQASLVKLVSSQTHFLKKKKGNNLEGVVTVHGITGHIYIGQILAMVVQEFMKTDILDTSGTYWEVMGHYSIKSRTVDRVTWKKNTAFPPSLLALHSAKLHSPEQHICASDGGKLYASRISFFPLELEVCQLKPGAKQWLGQAAPITYCTPWDNLLIFNCIQVTIDEGFQHNLLKLGQWGCIKIWLKATNEYTYCAGMKQSWELCDEYKKSIIILQVLCPQKTLFFIHSHTKKITMN